MISTKVVIVCGMDVLGLKSQICIFLYLRLLGLGLFIDILFFLLILALLVVVVEGVLGAGRRCLNMMIIFLLNLASRCTP